MDYVMMVVLTGLCAGNVVMLLSQGANGVSVLGAISTSFACGIWVMGMVTGKG